MAITYDMHDVVEGLRAMEARGRDLSPVLTVFTEMVRADIYQHFDEARDAGGGAWPEYAASTIKRISERRGGTYKRGRRAGQHTRKTEKRLSNKLGAIKSAWRVEKGNTSLLFINKVGFAGVHAEGGRAGLRSVIPARDFVYLSEGIEVEFVAALELHVAGAF